MAKLIIMRHAKAEKSELFDDDFERPLAKRGFEDAALICDFLKKENYIPDYIVASPSKRTSQTCDIVLNYFKDYKIKSSFEFDIYEASIMDLIHTLRKIPSKHKKVMLIGHNPSVTGVIGFLTGVFVEHVATSGIAVLKFNISNWQLTSQNCADLVCLKNPKELYKQK